MPSYVLDSELNELSCRSPDLTLSLIYASFLHWSGLFCRSEECATDSCLGERMRFQNYSNWTQAQKIFQTLQLKQTLRLMAITQLALSATVGHWAGLSSGISPAQCKAWSPVASPSPKGRLSAESTCTSSSSGRYVPLQTDTTEQAVFYKRASFSWLNWNTGTV